MTSKTQATIFIAAVVVAYIVGRYTGPTKTITQIQTVEVKSTETATKQNEHKKEKIVTKANGDTITWIDDTKETDRDTKQTDSTSKSRTTETTRGVGLTVSALGGLAVKGTVSRVYGASVTKTILGPLSVGAWGLNNDIFGVSVGVNF